MPLPSYLTKPLRWLRAGYPSEAPPHGYVPLIVLMPTPAAQLEDLLDAGELPASQLPRPSQAMRHRKEPREDRDHNRPKYSAG